MKKQHIIPIVLTVAAALAVALVFRSYSPTKKHSIKVGVILPLTGPSSAVGSQIRQAITLAVDHLPPDVEFIFEDSANEPAKGVAAFNKLASSDMVDTVIVAMSGISKSVAPLAKDNQLPTFAISTSVPIVHSNEEYVIRYFIDGVSEAKVMAEFAIKNGYNRVGVVQINDEYGKLMYESFASTLRKSGITPIHTEPLERDTLDYRSQANRLLSKNLDFLYFIGYAKPLGIAIRHSFESGIRIPYATTFGFEIPGTKELAAEAAERIIFTSVPFGQGADLSLESQRFVEAFQKRYSSPPSNDAAFAYDLAKNLPEILDAAALKDPRVIEGKSIVSQFGAVRFNENLEATIPIILKTVKHGMIETLQKD